MTTAFALCSFVSRFITESLKLRGKRRAANEYSIASGKIFVSPNESEVSAEVCTTGGERGIIRNVRSHEPKRLLLSQIGRWLAELILVFLGAYAAFWLSGYQQHQGDARRRDQILAALEDEAKQSLTDAQRGASKQEARVAEFRRALVAGEMPPLRPIDFSSDYNPGDVSTLLQAGGLELLDAKTIFALRASESAMRGGLSRLVHVRETERRTDRAESRSGHFLFLRSGDQTVAETFCPVPGRHAVNHGFFSRGRTRE